MPDTIQPVTYATYYTHAGERLNAKLLAQGGEPRTPFTRWGAGAGIHDAAAGSLQASTRLLDERQTGAFAWIEIVNDRNVELRFNITNEPPLDVDAPYNITEVGIYATDPDDGEILYAILVPEQLEGVTLDQMMPYDGRQAAVIQIIVTVSVAQADVAYIAPAAGVYAPADQVLMLRDRVLALEAALTALHPAGETSIPASAWTGTGSGASVRIPIPECSAQYMPQVIAMQDAAEIAIAAGMELVCEAVDGAVVVYADTVPESDLRVLVSLQRATRTLSINWR